MKRLIITIITFLCLMSLLTSLASAQDLGQQKPQKIKLFEVSEEEAAKYVIDTSNIEYAIPVDSDFEGNSIRLQAESIPYYFEFEFDSNLVSQDIMNTVDNATIYITSVAEWQNPEAEEEFRGSEYNYYDITLYGPKRYSKTVRYIPNGKKQIGTFTGVPKGEIYFYMSKHRLTWSKYLDGREVFDGDIEGDGKVHYNK